MFLKSIVTSFVFEQKLRGHGRKVTNLIISEDLNIFWLALDKESLVYVDITWLSCIFLQVSFKLCEIITLWTGYSPVNPKLS
jgi:hypothetical protein